jgi:hypothetical protein
MFASSRVNAVPRMRRHQFTIITILSFVLLTMMTTKTTLVTATSSTASVAQKTKLATTTMAATTNGNKKEQEEECKAAAAASSSSSSSSLDFLNDLREKYARHQPVFIQAVEEMALSLQDLFQDAQHGDYYKRAFVTLAEPERTISFRVPWTDDAGNLHFHRGWRVEFSRYVSKSKANLVRNGR